jgi:hypothetical protein
MSSLLPQDGEEAEIEIAVEAGPLGIDVSSFTEPGSVDGYAIRFDSFTPGAGGIGASKGIEKHALEKGMVVMEVNGNSAFGIACPVVQTWLKKRPCTIGFGKGRWAGETEADDSTSESQDSGRGARKLSAVSQSEKSERDKAISSFFAHYASWSEEAISAVAGMDQEAFVTFAKDAQLIPTDHDAETTSSRIQTSDIGKYSIGQEFRAGHIVSFEPTTSEWGGPGCNDKFRGQNIKTLKIQVHKTKINRSGQDLTRDKLLSDEELLELEIEIRSREEILQVEAAGPVTQGPGMLVVETTTGRLIIDKEKAAKAEKRIVLIFQQVKVGKKSRLTEERFAEALRKIAVELSITLTVLTKKIERALEKLRSKPTDEELERVAVAVTDEMDELREHLATMAKQSQGADGIYGDLNMADKVFFANERARKKLEQELEDAQAGLAIKTLGMGTEQLSKEDESFFAEKRAQLKMDQALEKANAMKELQTNKDISAVLQENWEKGESGKAPKKAGGEAKETRGSLTATGKSLKKVRKSFAPGGLPQKQ